MDYDDERTPLLASASRLPPAQPTLLAQLGQAYGALQAGRYPSTNQVAVIIHRILDSSLLQVETGLGATAAGEGRFSVAGRRTITDLRSLLKAIATVFEQKNARDELQNFLWHSQHASLDLQTEFGKQCMTLSFVSSSCLPKESRH